MRDFLAELGIEEKNFGASTGDFFATEGEWLDVFSPIDGELIAKVKQAGPADYERVMSKGIEVFARWRMTPAPRRGEIVRQMAMALREKKTALAKLVTLEMGKILPEGEGEVQEMIDMADLAVGMSRQLCGQVFQSERPKHRMVEVWHPLGMVGIISAFNFPVAVWAWNAFVAAVCGDVMIWKPSSQTPLTALAVTRIMNGILAKHGFAGVMGLVVGPGRAIGERLLNDRRIPLISATGSNTMGERVAVAAAKRYGNTILELGGNNALVVMEDADLDMALRAVLFGAVGTAGQRCTSTRRLLLHKDIAQGFLGRLVKAYGQVRIGDPLDTNTVMGPLVNTSAVNDMMNAIDTIKKQGGEIIYGGAKLNRAGGCYVEPCIVKAKRDMPIVQDETFAPILYAIEIDSIDDAIAVQNGVPQGLSSSIFTRSFKYAEQFTSHMGSDCGIANVNVGTSGAEIGGAFGGEKDTGGGREAGSDSWKAYMRRQTQTINWSDEMPLAQGISFG
ncbi:MAG: aldehyde dehydrogenase [Deltaproteobacteria bacterium RIFOXYB12_FULL_58_9]|nr:MAG: aldehyde dehydrogenase [Deltaproteobacteria bacterium RIFOXYB12_FULL_58_9]